MTRLGGMYGPDATFLGVDRADLADPPSWAGTDVMIIGAPFDGGTSHRPGARFGPQAIRFTDYLPHDGPRPHLAPGGGPLGALRTASPLACPTPGPGPISPWAWIRWPNCGSPTPATSKCRPATPRSRCSGWNEQCSGPARRGGGPAAPRGGAHTPLSTRV